MGLGNRCRSDDGVGLAVIAELRERRLPSSVEVLEGLTDTLGLVEAVLRACGAACEIGA